MFSNRCDKTLEVKVCSLSNVNTLGILLYYMAQYTSYMCTVIRRETKITRCGIFAKHPRSPPPR